MEYQQDCNCGKSKKCKCIIIKLQPGETGPAGPPGRDGVQGPPGIMQLDYVIAASAIETPSGAVINIAPYYQLVGNLSSALNADTGIFTAPGDGLYLVTINTTYQRRVGEDIQIDDGTRQVRLVRPNLTVEYAFIGQSVWVNLPTTLTTDNPFYQSFNVKLSTSAVIELGLNNQIYLITYQDNSRNASITAYTELSISRLSQAIDDNSLNKSSATLCVMGI